MANQQTYHCKIIKEGNLTAIPVPFDPKAVFGKVRAPVVVQLKGYEYRSTISSMKGKVFIPFRKSHVEASGVDLDAEIEITLTFDDAPREVEIPKVLAERLAQTASGLSKWDALSYTAKKEFAIAINDAKKEETKLRRLEKIVGQLS
ncbi:YdeI/OmpD-associated family protein [Psychrobium sp. MM17-31]|uniref:YdeI/OmpD-associated family protein n=1 Tax=Psychrobium sp. MM17-31 TaxID=2917758 RepID=UPI001EF46648|nr:YdeI/OmpD-associated family protein [Psychrobium sp. MM17-31]MCG7532492.1 YdeI/OmpD-associated family protein [Psychrobium sp. MM17-31]